MAKAINIENVKKGELFTRKNIETPNEKQVFTADGFCRSSKKYTGTRYSDVCDQVYIKKGTTVYIDFEF